MKFLNATAFFAALSLQPLAHGADTEFSPDQVMGLQLWLMADKGVQTQKDLAGNSRGVISWSDHSGQENHLVGISREPYILPSFVPAVGSIDHKPAIEFRGMGGSNFKGAQALIGKIYLLANKDWIAAFNLPWLMQKPE
jgi:hypothetical protein